MPVRQILSTIQDERDTLKKYQINEPTLYESNSFIPRQKLPPRSKSHEQTVWDNYGSPYRLKINRETIEVYQRKETPKNLIHTFGEAYFPNDPLFTLKHFEGVWYGYDPTDIDDADPVADSHSNTLLIQFDQNTYMWVGAMIKSIKMAPGEKMVDFITDLGNSGVPDPILITNKRAIHLFMSTYIALSNHEKIKLHQLSIQFYMTNDSDKKTAENVTTLVERTEM